MKADPKPGWAFCWGWGRVHLRLGTYGSCTRDLMKIPANVERLNGAAYTQHHSIHEDDPKEAIARFLGERYPDLDLSNRAGFLLAPQAIETRTTPKTKVEPGDVYLIELLCEDMFRQRIMPVALKA